MCQTDKHISVENALIPHFCVLGENFLVTAFCNFDNMEAPSLGMSFELT